MAKPYQEGKGWSVRVRAKGQDIYLSGYPSELAARKAAEHERASIENAGKPARSGPRKTTLAQAIQQYGLERLPALKGARRDAGRLNRYLRLSGLSTLKLEPIDRKGGGKRGVYWVVSLKDESSGRPVPSSLKAHRSNQLDNSIRSDALRQRLGNTMMADITPYQIQQIIDAMVEEGYEPATIAHERSELRRLFNHAKKSWLWTQPASNPASFLKLPPISNARDRIISNDEWQRLSVALKAYGNIYALPALSLLLETTMRSSEPLLHATWADVDFQRCLIHLQDAKAGPRAVPLSPAAIAILEELKLLAGKVTTDTPILPTTYEALKKAWVVACEEAGVDNANPHDLRHTGTTRYAIEFNGNMPVLKLITGHKTDSQLMRYINLKADHVVSMMHGKPMDEANAPAGLRIGNIRAPKPVSPVPPTESEPQQLPDNVIAFTGKRIA
jgi:integrase